MKIKKLKYIAVVILGAVFLMTANSFSAEKLNINEESHSMVASINNYGIQLDGGSLGKMTLSYPQMEYNNGKTRVNPTAVKIDGNVATLSYPENGSATLTLDKEAFSFYFSAIPAGLKAYRFEMHVPLSFGDGGTWEIGGKSGSFPKDYKNTKLYQGNAGDFKLLDAQNSALCILFPETFGWMELQDLREWNTTSYSLSVVTPFNADKRIIVVPFGRTSEAFANIRTKTEAAFFSSPAGKVAPPSAIIPRLSASLSDYGLEMDCGSMGKFGLSYPQLDLGDGDTRSKPIETQVKGNTANLKYKKGGAMTVKLDGDRFQYTFTSVPAGLKAHSHEMFIPFNYNQGGSWKVEGKSGPFPEQKVPGGKIFQGHSRQLEIADVNKSCLDLNFPANTYIELQDNREWGWNVFWSLYTTPFNPSEKTVSIRFGLDASTFQQAKLVDRFGQVPRDFAGKIKDESELIEDAKTDDAYYASLSTPLKLNRIGGLADSGAKYGLKKTGFFHVENKPANGKDRWILVDPEGDAFFHLGICGFGPGDDFTNVEGRQGAFEWLPSHDEKFGAAWKDKPGEWWNSRAVSFYKANVIRKYDQYDNDAQTSRFIDRVRKVGFNSVGAFSGIPSIIREKNFPYVEFLSFGGARDIKTVRGMFDPFDPETRTRIDKAMSGRIAKAADDPLLIGYFLANEQALEDIPRGIPQLDGSYACKQKLVEILQAKYKTIGAFNTAWNLNAASFDELKDRGLPLNSKESYADMQAYTEKFFEAYYSVITETFHKYDRNHMLIGNRWQPGTANNETLCRVAGKYMDVISINYYAAGVDEAFIRRLYEWTGRKPQFWSEFYYTATKESNSGPGGHDMATQRERGLAYRNYLENGASLGFVVGIEWFTLIDQAATGRFFEGLNGERNNTGLFNVADRPYKDMFAEMNKSHVVLYDIWLDGKAPFEFDDPRFNAKAGAAVRTVSAGHPIAAIKVDGQQNGYPLRPPERISSDHLVIGRDANGLEGSFKATWDSEKLYLLVNISDQTPMMNENVSSSSWSGDCLELFIGSEQLDKGGPMLFTDRQILLGAGASNSVYVPNVAKQPTIETAVVPAVDGKGYVIEAAIPWSALDITPKENMTILFDIAIDNSDDGKGRTAQIVWNGTARNSGDRSAWGRLILVP
ncbi:MAG: hypothetical protein PF692_01500 [Kiritimatiellae bacterium]|jgi:hypothetical protein|nr:hypothetical protein [Kiritimatiellia bacterium]